METHEIHVVICEGLYKQFLRKLIDEEPTPKISAKIRGWIKGYVQREIA